jgi:hypothetical protein
MKSDDKNHLHGSSVKVSTDEPVSLKVDSIELYEKIYTENEHIINIMSLFNKFEIKEFDNPEDSQSIPLKQIEEFKFDYNKVGLLNVNVMLGNGSLKLRRTVSQIEEEKGKVIPFSHTLLEDKDAKDNREIKLLTGQLHEETKQSIIGIGR